MVAPPPPPSAAAGLMMDLMGADSKVITLSFGREATSLSAGTGFGFLGGSDDEDDESAPQHEKQRRRHRHPNPDALLLGTAQSVLAYDVATNKEYFYRELEDGVRTIVHGKILCSAAGETTTTPATASSPSATTPSSSSSNSAYLTVVGGNGAVIGYSEVGEEAFFAVTGEHVTAMSILPWQQQTGSNSAERVEVDFSPSSQQRLQQQQQQDAPPPLRLLAASQDNVIRVFHGASVLSSIVEADTVHRIVPQYNAWARANKTRTRDDDDDDDHEDSGDEDNEDVNRHSSRFAYLLENGTVGVYDGAERVWRIKGKEKAVAAAFCDVDGDGEEELIVGWENGKLEVRGLGEGRGGAASPSSGTNANTEKRGGEVLFRHEYAHPIAGVVAGQYRGQGTAPLPLVTTTDGLVQGLLLHELHQQQVEDARLLGMLEEKMERKRELMAQLESLDSQLAVLARGEEDTTMPSVSTTLKVGVTANPLTQKLDVHFAIDTPHPSTVISAVVLRCDPAMGSQGEDAWCFVAGDTPSSFLYCPIHYDKVQFTRLHASVCVGGVNASNSLVLESFIEVPPFAMYRHADVLRREYPGWAPTKKKKRENSNRRRRGWGEEVEEEVNNNNNNDFEEETEEESGGARRPFVSFFFNSDLHIDDIVRVLHTLFSIPQDMPFESFSHDENGNEMSAFFRVPIVNVLTRETIRIEVRQPASTTAWRIVTFEGASMTFSGDLIQEMEKALPNGFAENISSSHGGSDNASLPVHIRYRFDAEGEALREVLSLVHERSEARNTLTIGMADSVAALRLLLIQAEDSRLLGEYASMKKSYASVMDYNYELLSDNRKRMNNFDELRSALREVNAAIQRAARLRLGGEAKGTFVTACRSALKENNVMQLLDLITTGVQ